MKNSNIARVVAAAAAFGSLSLLPATAATAGPRADTPQLTSAPHTFELSNGGNGGNGGDGGNGGNGSCTGTCNDSGNGGDGGNGGNGGYGGNG